MSQNLAKIAKDLARNPENYKQHEDQIKNLVKKAQPKDCKEFINIVKKIIKDKTTNPQGKLVVLQMLDKGMYAYSTYYLDYVIKKILSRLEILARYRKESKDENRGSTIFQNLSLQSKEAAEASAQFLKYLLRILNE